MYVCGPTVYNYIHIGNARSAVAFDTVRRYFEYRGYEVDYVSNFTDVDDKIIKAGHEMKMTVKEVTDKFIAAFYEDIDALNIKRATLNPRVMDTMDDIIKFIQVLIDKGYAYQSEGDVYYRARKFKDYGKLSGQSVDDLEQGASERVADFDQGKKKIRLILLYGKPQNQVKSIGKRLWERKARLAHRMLRHGNEVFGQNDRYSCRRPGFGISAPRKRDCPKRSRDGAEVRQLLDAQRIRDDWRRRRKMSKSLGNFVTVHDLLKKVDPQVVRFFMATTQYRHPIRYSQANLAEAKTNLQKLKTAVDNLRYRKNDAEKSDVETEIREKFSALKNRFIEAMDDDFNTQNGIAVIYEMAKLLNVYSEKATVSLETIEYLLDGFSKAAEVFGIKFEEETELLDEKIEALIEERIAARKARNFARSDEIRDMLKEKGVILEDTPQGTRWKRA